MRNRWSITIQLVTDVQHGTLTLNQNGSFIYTGNALTSPNPFVDSDSFTYQISDGISTSDVVTVLITKNLNTGSSISGLQFDELDGDGNFEPGLGETVAADVRIFLDLDDDGVFDSANEPSQLTAADGTFLFTGLAAQDYRVRQLLPNGTRATWPVASSASSLIIQPGVTDIVFDTTRQILYIAAGDGTIRRFSEVARAFLSPIVVGGAAVGLDITPDNSTLYVADSLEVADKAFIRKVNLADGSLTTLEFDTPGVETGAFDISIGANGKALITTTSSNASPVPLRQLVLATGVISVRADAPGNAGGGLVGSGTRIYRGADRSRLLLTEGTDATGPLFTYLSGPNSFLDGPSTADLTNTHHSAPGASLSDIDLSPEGALIASGLAGDVLVLDEALMDAPVKISSSSNPAFVAFGALRSASGLTLIISPTTFVESAGTTAAFGMVSRPSAGNDAAALTVNLSSSDTTEATVPATVTILAGNVSATFAIAAVNDAVGDGPQNVTITATASGQASANTGLTVTDDEFNYYTLSFAPTSMSESGGSLTGTVTRTVLDNSGPVTVNLFSDDTTEATVPLTVVILAGQNTANFTVTAVDDALRDGTQTPNITASAAGLASGSGPVSVTDNEVDTIAISIGAGSISENGGTTTGTVSRAVLNNSASLIVTLTSDDTTEAAVPGTVTIPAGQNSVIFTLNAVNDSLRDGTQHPNITAAASGVASVSATLDVTDDEVDSLSLSFLPTSMSENGGAIIGTLTRNVLSNVLPMVVTLNSGDTTEATVPVNVTILPNQISERRRRSSRRRRFWRALVSEHRSYGDSRLLRDEHHGDHAHRLGRQRRHSQ